MKSRKPIPMPRPEACWLFSKASRSTRFAASSTSPESKARYAMRLKKPNALSACICGSTTWSSRKENLAFFPLSPGTGSSGTPTSPGQHATLESGPKPPSLALGNEWQGSTNGKFQCQCSCLGPTPDGQEATLYTGILLK